MTKTSALGLQQVYADLKAAGAEVVAVRAVDDNGGLIKLPASFVDSKENVQGARGFAYLANEAPDKQIGIQVKILPLSGPNRSKISGFMDPADAAAYVAGK